MELKCCIAIVLMLIRVFLVSDFLNLYAVRRVWITGLCVVPLASTIMTMSGATFHPFICMSFISGRYFVIFAFILSSGYRLFVYINSMNWIVIEGFGWVGGWVGYLGKGCHEHIIGPGGVWSCIGIVMLSKHMVRAMMVLCYLVVCC
jgi:hypothetical protein